MQQDAVSVYIFLGTMGIKREAGYYACLSVVPSAVYYLTSQTSEFQFWLLKKPKGPGTKLFEKP